MSEENQNTPEIEKHGEVFVVVFPSHDKPAEDVQPCEKAFDFPPSDLSHEGAAILGLANAVATVGRDHFSSVDLCEVAIERIAIVGFIADEAFRKPGPPEAFQGRFDSFHFSRRSAFCPSGDRKTIAADDSPNLGSLAPLGLPFY